MAIDLSKKNELQWIKEGRVFQSVVGDLTTPVAMDNVDLVRQTPEFLLRTPPGVVVVPLRVQYALEVQGTEIWQCIISSCNNDPGVANVTQVTPVNCNTRFVNSGSAVTTYRTATGNTGTAPSAVTDHLRVYIATDVDAGNENGYFEQIVYSPLHGRGTPCIIGDDSHIEAFMLYGAITTGTSPTGYILAQWSEWTYDEFYAE